MRCEQSEERIPSLGQYNYSKELTNSVNMYYYINQNKYLINENKYNFMSGDPIKYKPYPPIIKNIHRITKRKDLYEYQPTNGNAKDKKVISNYLNNIGINATTGNITFTYSTTHAFNLIFQCLAKAGDGIIIPVPSYGLFDFVPERFGLKVIFLPLKKENDWLINPIDLENTIKDFECKNSESKISFLYNMNPHNPTGKVMSYDNIDILKKIGNLSLKYNFYIIDDLIYRDLTFNNNKMPVPISSIKEYFNSTISLFGISKSYNLAAIRSGMIVSNVDIANKIQDKIYQTMDSISIINIQSLVAAFNINNKKQYKKYFKNLISKYLFNFYLLKYLIEGPSSILNTNIKKKCEKIIKKYLSNSDYEYAIKNVDELSFVEKLDNVESGFFALLKVKTNLNYYELFSTLFEITNIKVICGNSIMYMDDSEKIIRINFSVQPKCLILGITHLKKYLDKNK